MEKIERCGRCGNTRNLIISLFTKRGKKRIVCLDCKDVEVKIQIGYIKKK